MGRLSILAALILGALLGGLAVFAWTPARSDRDLTGVHPTQLSTPDLAHILMARVARNLVAARSPKAPMSDGAVLFAAPKPYGGVLCSVKTYAFPAWIVRGRRTAADAQRPWQDDLQITERYSVWREPGGPVTPGLTPQTACDRQQDLQHLIVGDGPAVERDVALLDVAIRQARSGAVPFALSCEDRRSGSSAPCDGLDILRKASVRQIRQVGGDWDGGGPARAEHLDMVFLDARAAGAACGQSETLTFELHTAPAASGEDTLKTVKVSRDHIC
jgi:hypothetical protein